MHLALSRFVQVSFGSLVLGVLGLAAVTPVVAVTTPTLTGQVNATDKQAWNFTLDLPTTAPMQITCTDIGNPGEKLNIMGNQLSHYDVKLRGFKTSTTYRCLGEVMNGSKQRSNLLTIKIDPLPSDLSAPIIQTRSVDNNYLLFNYGVQVLQNSVIKSHYLVIMDHQGEIRWYYPLAVAAGGCNDVDATYLAQNGGEVLFAGCAGGTSFPPTIVGLDKQVKFTATRVAANANEVVGGYNHDGGISSDGKSIFTMGYGYYPANSVYPEHIGYIVKQIDLATNTLLWSWDATLDGLATTQHEHLDVPTYYDFAHGNAVIDRWENGRLYIYVSMRNASQIVKIDVATKQIQWKLGIGGDFQLQDAQGAPITDQSQWFFNQHDVKLYDDTMVMHDNGTERTSHGGTYNYTRALKIQLDQGVNKSAKIVSGYTEPNWVEPYWGGTDLLSNGNFSIAMGHCWLCDTSNNSALVEVDSQDSVVWRANFLSNQVVTYRSDYINDCKLFSVNQVGCGN